VFLSDRATMLELSKKMQDATASATWEFPVGDEALTLEQARTLSAAAFAPERRLERTSVCSGIWYQTQVQSGIQPRPTRTRTRTRTHAIDASTGKERCSTAATAQGQLRPLQAAGLTALGAAVGAALSFVKNNVLKPTATGVAGVVERVASTFAIGTAASTPVTLLSAAIAGGKLHALATIATTGSVAASPRS
jgi:hypothetical protein